MLITINDNYIVDIKKTRKILNERGFNCRIIKHKKQLFSVHLMPKAQNRYPDEITALQQIEFVVKHKYTNKIEQRKIIINN